MVKLELRFHPSRSHSDPSVYVTLRIGRYCVLERTVFFNCDRDDQRVTLVVEE